MGCDRFTTATQEMPVAKATSHLPMGRLRLVCDSALGEDEVGFLVDPQGGSLSRNDEAEGAR